MKKRKLIEVIILVLLGLIMIFVTHQYLNRQQVIEKDDVTDSPIPEIEYGINTDSLLVFKNEVKENQFLADILLSYGIEYQTIDLMVKKSDSVFDVKKIRPGDTYALLCKADSSETVQYFIYETSLTSYIVFDLRDTVHVESHEREITRELLSASGEISTSLWNELVRQGANPNLALEMSEVYAWAIDFFGLQKGDQFRVIYEQLLVEDKVVGLGKIKAALFKHNSKDFYAYYFVQDSIGDYFDEEAQSLRRTFLKAPLRFSRISSRFSNSRLHPVLKIRRPHHGVDYAAPTGTPVQAIGDGNVIFAGRKGGAGNMIKIKHNGTYTTAYLHLSAYGKGIKQGAFVKQGDIIGYVGSTGLSTGPHLDFRFYKNGQAVDPLKVESPPAEPVDSTHMERFNLLVNNLKSELDHIQISKNKKQE
ncbi:M23 family metallopeptidase [Bacteroidota bacterium]